MAKYWADHALTGDNSRERPYADIYPRLTTKSNTYTIHMRVQTLQKLNSDADMQPNSPPGQTWTEGSDVITGEYRGSETIERFVDPSNSNIPDYVTAGLTASPIGQFYRFRVVNAKQFAPQ
jgi:hypothetical protein